VTTAPPDALERRAADAALARRHRRHRSDVVGIQRVAQPQREAERQRGCDGVRGVQYRNS
jgi:hypothetical protein